MKTKIAIIMVVSIFSASLAWGQGSKPSLRDRAKAAFSSSVDPSAPAQSQPRIASQSSNSSPREGLPQVFAATVQIEIYDKTGSKKGSGSGFIVDSKGIIVTNNHVLQNGAGILIKLPSGDAYKDIVVRDFDEVKDIAIFKVSGFDLPSVKMGNSNQVTEGQKILTCGNTLGEYANSVSDGVVSGIRHNEKGFKYIQVSAPISPGNSGGPVCLETGEVIGISTASRIDGQNVNFAIPINYVIGMLDNDRKLTYAQYSGMCGQGMEHVIGDESRKDLAHPDCDISKRIVIVPFNGFCQFMPNIGEEILAGLVLRLKANFKDEELFVVDHQTVVENLKETSGDRYDALLKSFDQEKAKEFAVKFRANTVIFGKVNHFEIDNSPTFIPFVGWVPGSKAIMNVDWSVYKLDSDKVIMASSVRRKQDNLGPAEGVLKIANVIVGAFKDKFKTFAASNKTGAKPIMVTIQGDKPQVVPKL